MVDCTSCGDNIDIEALEPGKLVKCGKCNKKFEVVKDGSKKELYETEVDYGK